MIADALSWNLDRIAAEQAEPVIAGNSVKSVSINLRPGYVAGMRQKAAGYRDGNPVISLDFQAYIGAKEESDQITIEGTPKVCQRITPCVHGDLGTVAIVANSIPKVINAPPGLVTMKDLPVPSAWNETFNSAS
jgi:4-hydroxy-tetrahydrodipicolinate reductase